MVNNSSTYKYMSRDMIYMSRSSGFPTRSDTNRSVQSQKKATDLKLQDEKKRDCTNRVVKTKALTSCAAPLFSHR